MKKIDITGKQINKLKVLREIGRSIHGAILWECKCDCGVIKTVNGDHLKQGNTKSCGCLNSELVTKRNYRHGSSVRGHISVEYTAWAQMIGRCYNRKNYRYIRYGKRGIKVCRRWRYSFDTFFKDIGKRPTKLHSLERINNDKNYSPKNCKWATEKEQQRNKSSNRWLEYNGLKMILSDWAVRLNTSHSNILRMLKTKPFNKIVEYYMIKNGNKL